MSTALTHVQEKKLQGILGIGEEINAITSRLTDTQSVLLQRQLQDLGTLAEALVIMAAGVRVEAP